MADNARVSIATQGVVSYASLGLLTQQNRPKYGNRKRIKRMA